MWKVKTQALSSFFILIQPNPVISFRILANGKSFKWKVIDKDKFWLFAPGLLIDICPSPSNKPAKYEPR